MTAAWECSTRDRRIPLNLKPIRFFRMTTFGSLLLRYVGPLIPNVRRLRMWNLDTTPAPAVPDSALYARHISKEFRFRRVVTRRIIHA